MNPSTVRYLSLSALSIGLVLLAGCNRSNSAEAKATVKDAIADVKASTSNAWDKVKDYTYDKRSDFTAEAKAVSSRFDADVSKMRTEYSEAKASSSRKSAMAELKNSESDYKEKLDALGHATADTWTSSKQNVILAWDKLQAAYYKARAD